MPVRRRAFGCLSFLQYVVWVLIYSQQEHAPCCLAGRSLTRFPHLPCAKADLGHLRALCLGSNLLAQVLDLFGSRYRYSFDVVHEVLNGRRLSPPCQLDSEENAVHMSVLHGTTSAAIAGALNVGLAAAYAVGADIDRSTVDGDCSSYFDFAAFKARNGGDDVVFVVDDNCVHGISPTLLSALGLAPDCMIAVLMGLLLRTLFVM